MYPLSFTCVLSVEHYQLPSVGDAYTDWNDNNNAYGANDIVQELCESRSGRPGLSVLTRLMVSVDVELY